MPTKTDLLGKLWARARPHRAVQAVARRGDQVLQRQAAGLHHPAAAAAGLRTRRRGDHDWAALRAAALAAKKSADCVPVLATDPLYILTPRARPENPKAWCATMAGIWSR